MHRSEREREIEKERDTARHAHRAEGSDTHDDGRLDSLARFRAREPWNTSVFGTFYFSCASNQVRSATRHRSILPRLDDSGVAILRLEARGRRHLALHAGTRTNRIVERKSDWSPGRRQRGERVESIRHGGGQEEGQGTVDANRQEGSRQEVLSFSTLR